MTDLIQIPDDDREKFLAALNAIQQPRTDYELEKYVVGQHDTEPRRFAQCTLELDIKLQNIRRGQIVERQLERRIAALRKKNTDAANDKADLLAIDLEDHRKAMLGAAREFQALLAIWRSFNRTYTREDLNAAEAEYWQRRLSRQAALDINASGRIGVGNQDALRMAGMAVPGLPDYIRDVEQRFLEVGRVRMLIATPTLIPKETVERDGLNCHKGWTIPATMEQKTFVVLGRPVADAYIEAAQTALRDGATHILTVEDDHIIPPGAFERLWELHQQAGDRSIVGAWYPQKREPRTGVPIVIRNNCREYLQDDGEVYEVFTVPMGFTLIPVQAFRDLPRPWFATTGNVTQDSFFSQLAREAGYTLLVDTSVRIKHVCRETGKVYE